MTFIVWCLVLGGLVLGLSRARWSFQAWTWTLGAGLLLLTLFGLLSVVGGIVLWGLFVFLALLNFPGLRIALLSRRMFAYLRKVLPPLSETEREAIDAGTSWWEAELFQGNPDWQKLIGHGTSTLSEEEQAFLDGPVEELCRMLDDWEMTNELSDLPVEAWEFLKKSRFFGMIIPKKYGGLEFSAIAHSSVIMKIVSRSSGAAVTVMVPNSLGPAELLLHYGTEEQKDHYLPRLATGEEIPCFALTGPDAGSDAGAMPDTGVICRGEFEGEEVLGVRLNWAKRYITLGPVATVLGLAFKAYDPDGLLGGEEDLGITCALVPADTPGVRIGRRHNPLNASIQNGPNWGEDVFIPIDWVIGGQDQIGNGWRMLVECLSVGRGISLPALSAGAGKFISYMTGAYTRVRRQFGIPIGRFEGVQEALARIGGLTYMMEAGRRLTASAIDHGEKPSVATAVLKHYSTESMRRVINDAMDVHGGRGICLGPSNYLAQIYQSMPMSVTVEGANILVRSLIVFGQGAMRCHPYLMAEMNAAMDPDEEAGLREFDRILFRHMGYTVCNGARSFLYGVTRSRLAPSPVAGPTQGYFKRLARISAGYAFVSDFALLFLGGSLKRRESLSGRFADALGYMYLCSAILKHYQETGRPAMDFPLVEWGAKYCLYHAQHALDEIMRNFPSRIVGQLLRAVVFPTGRSLHYPNDALGQRVAEILIEPSATRDRLTEGIFKSTNAEDITGRVQHALAAVIAAEEANRKLVKAGISPADKGRVQDWLGQAVEQGIITQAEAELVERACTATSAAITVDDFAPGSEAGKPTEKVQASQALDDMP